MFKVILKGKFKERKMLKEAEANGGTISVKRAREVIKNATSN